MAAIPHGIIDFEICWVVILSLGVGVSFMGPAHLKGASNEPARGAAMTSRPQLTNSLLRRASVNSNTTRDGTHLSSDCAREGVMTRRFKGAAFAGMLGFGAMSFLNAAAYGEPGVFDDRIVFGQSAAFDGPAAALGLGMREGILAAFNEANAARGISGHKLELVSHDDSYDPEKAIANTKRLIDEERVFALVGEVGTPTSNAAQPITTEKGVPFIGPFTGAAFLRNPSLGNVINVRGSYDQEAEAWIEHLTKDLGTSRIAILYQDDTFGRAGLSGVMKAMDRPGISPLFPGPYVRTTPAV